MRERVLKYASVYVCMYVNPLHSFNGKFKIDRSSPHCQTPRRNPEIDLYLAFARPFSNWADGVARTIAADDSEAQGLTDRGMFVPIAPLFEQQDRQDESVLLPSETSIAMLAEQKRSIAERLAELAKVFTANNGRLISNVEAQVIALMRHAESILSITYAGIHYVEDMLCVSLRQGCLSFCVFYAFVLSVVLFHFLLFSKSSITQLAVSS